MSKFVRRSVTIVLSVLLATFLMAGAAFAQTSPVDGCTEPSYPIPPGGCGPETEVEGEVDTPPAEQPETEVGGGTTVTPSQPETDVEGDTVTQPQTQVLGTSTTPGQSTVFAQQGLAATGIDAGVIALLAVIGLLAGTGLILISRKRA